VNSSEDQNTANILVTGASGRLGRKLIEALVEEGNLVKALVIGKEEIRTLPQGAIPIIGTLNDMHVLDDACQGTDVVFHLAAAMGEVKAKTGELMHVNVDGTEKLLEPCRRRGVKHIIFTSTVEVYGKSRHGELTEQSDLKPSDKYAYSKMLAEKAIVDSNVPYTIMRIATIYGPDFENSFFKVFRVIKDGNAAIIGNGQNHLSLVHVHDTINALMLAKNKKEVSRNKIYNLAEEGTMTQEDLFDIAAEALGVEKPKRHVSEFLIRMIARQRNLDSNELGFLTADRTVDTSKIQGDLNFEYDEDAHIAIKDMVNDFMNKSRTAGLGYSKKE
jgi:nucleoside-diphosphate-sugar epimerase